MCGFVGYINNKEKNKAIIEGMNRRIIHRGPDSCGYYMDEVLHMGFRRLSIIDLKSGDQPIYNEDETKVIMFNGEIYNFEELREDLKEKGHVFKTNSDTEVVLHGYEEFGPEILQKLRGMFAFVIWDIVKKEIFIARDIFGIKPLYYAHMNDTFMFASEIKAFLDNPDFVREINKDALKPFMTFQYNPLNETFFKGVYKLEPRHYIKYSADQKEKITPVEYFDIDFSGEGGVRLDDIEKTIASSVEYHKISDVKVGSFLSSGIDSSYIVSLLKPDDTFTVGFDHDGFDETDRAKVLSESLGIKNTKKTITSEEFFEALPKVQYYSDEPHANLSSVPLFYLSEMAKKDVTVVLSGEGADELFGGYDTYNYSSYIRMYRRLPKFLRVLNGKVAELLPNFKGKHFLIRGKKNLEESYIGQAMIFDAKEVGSVLTPEYMCGPDSKEITKPYFDRAKGLDDISKMQFVDMFLWLPNDILLKADKMTMAHSLELRVPYLDKEVLKLATKLKMTDKLRDGIGKYALRQAASSTIPKEWFERKKLGFLVPFKDYLKEDKYYKMIKEEFEQDYVAEFFKQDEIMKLLDDHHNGVRETHRKVYTIYSFLLWYKEYFLVR